MHEHGSDLPAAEILTPSPPPRIGSVYALGLSDVLSVELRSCQLAGFADEHAEMRGPLGEAYESARGRWLEMSRLTAGGPSSQLHAAEEKLGAASYALRLHAAIGSQLAQPSTDEPLVVVGPATMISSIIEGATRNAADGLAGSLRGWNEPSSEHAATLRHCAAALTAWIETYIDCQQVEMYSFDPHFSPVAGGL